ncbi:protein FAR1-RELATED SEQUENCE 6-like, partial [Trifolium medium]|nr:protein FAR1-RELATED SEQUENCE 6-like [Trifolium medium]
MVGATSTGMTFNVAFAFMSNEKEENFTWTLQQCRSLLRSEGLGPKVTVTDRDTALMNSVAQVFPDASPLVCRYHVLKNVTAKCKSLCKTRDGDQMSHSEVVNLVTDSFVAVLDAPTKETYAQAVVEFRKVCEKWPIFRNYVQKTVLDTDETKVVKAWTNDIMHFGNTTTNRAEGAHGVLKKYLSDGNGDFIKVWEAIEKMLTNQFSGIKTSFGQSLSVEEHRYGEHNNFLYPLIKFKISRTALDFIFYEAKRVVDCGSDPKKCGCVIRKTYGLPCACVIAKKIRNRRPIRLDEINMHWKKLVIENGEDVEGGDEEIDDYSCTAEFEAIKERLKSVDVIMKADIRDKLRQIAFPETTTMTSPIVSTKAKVVKNRGARI